MKERDITRVTLDPVKPTRGKTDWTRVKALPDAEVNTAAASDPDSALPAPRELDEFVKVPDPRQIRQQLHLSQEEFAARFHLSLGALRDWEQGKHRPDRAAQTLLTIIARNPNAVLEALR